MSIDWFTVVAQLANFLLLIWLLRRFLYRPILDGIDAREAEIARRLDSADQARVEAESAQKRYLEQHARSLAGQETAVASALQATKAERDRLLAEGHAQLEEERKEWQRHLEAERKDFLERLHRAGALTLSELVRKVLGDLADAKLEAAIARNLGRHLAPMAAELSAAAGQTQVARITTHEALDPATHDALRAELTQLLPGLDWEFAVDDAQARGLTIQAGGARLEWTIDSYMDEFDRLMAQSHTASLALPAHGDER